MASSTAHSNQRWLQPLARRRWPVQRINDRGLRGVVGGGIGPARDADGAILRIVIRQILFMFPAVIGSLCLVARAGRKSGPGCNGPSGFPNPAPGSSGTAAMARFRNSFCCSGLAALHLGALEIGLAQFVDHFVILAEIKLALVKFGIAVFEDAAKFGDSLGPGNRSACPPVR